MLIIFFICLLVLSCTTTLKDINTQRSTEETIISKWHCPVVDTKELDKAKAELDKLSQRIIPITDITDVEGK